MNTLLFPMDRVVSMDEIDDYFETRGRWNGKRFELASTPAKKLALWRSLAATWLMRAGWAVLAVLAAPPVSIAVVLGISVVAHPARISHVAARDRQRTSFLAGVEASSKRVPFHRPRVSK